MDKNIVATTDRVVLRRWRGSDSDVVFAICQDPAIQWWTTVPVPYTRQDATDYVVGVAERQWDDGSGAPLVLVERSSSRLIGSMSVLSFNEGVAAVGYWTAPEMRGHGYTTEGLRLLATWCFAERGVIRVELDVEDSNAASRRVAKGAGFTEEGTLRQRVMHRDRRIDVVMYSLLHNDEAARAMRP